jgi:hypothetical protein
VTDSNESPGSRPKRLIPEWVRWDELSSWVPEDDVPEVKQDLRRQQLSLGHLRVSFDDVSPPLDPITSLKPLRWPPSCASSSVQRKPKFWRDYNTPS